MNTLKSSSRIRNGLLVVAAMVGLSFVVALATWAYFNSRAPIYRASSVLYAESGPFYPYGLTSTLIFYLPRLDKVVFRQAVRSNSIAQQAFELAKLNNSPSAIESFLNRVDLFVAPGSNAYSDVIYLSVDDYDAQRAVKLGNGLARALVIWNDQRVRSMYQDHMASLVAQLKTTSISIAQLKKTDPDNADLSNLNSVRSGLLRDIQLMKGVAQTIKGDLKVLELATQANPVGLRPRYRAALAGVCSLVGLILVWLVVQTWRQTLQSTRRG